MNIGTCQHSCQHTLSNAVKQWKNLEYIFEEDQNLSIQQLQKFQRRYEQALTPYHLIPI